MQPGLRNLITDVAGLRVGQASDPLLRSGRVSFGGAIRGNAFYTIGGSRSPGIARNEGQVQVYRWSP